MKARQRAVAVLGWVFLICGIAGLVLPFLQGILFIFVGVLLLSGTSAWATRVEQVLSRRYPKVAGRAFSFVQSIKRRLGVLE